jgi:4-alpha-glucanotransferase
VGTASPIDRRRTGILLHPTSLPGPAHHGDFGSEAYRFVDFLAAAGQTVWQVLPLGQTHDGGSPYQCLSVHAGNPRLISLQRLVEQGWLEPGIAADLDPADEARNYANDGPLARALQLFRERADEATRADFYAFLTAAHDWLEDYALFLALRARFRHAAWTEWPAPLRDREEHALAKARSRYQLFVDLVRFEQFLFYRQWTELRRYANRKGILLFGDMPIFVAHDSVDVWAHRNIFYLDRRGQPVVVAGVPPDYFSAKGQRWGNPHYRWDAMAQDGYRWWIRRIESQLDLFDLIRIDHFRGFESFWEIPADREDAMEGRWVDGPGERLFDAFLARFGKLPFVAEDLGMITPAVLALRDKYALPGMKILQFAFDGSPDNPYLPHNHVADCVIYTGTHDNDTTVGWYQALSPQVKSYVMEYLSFPGEPMPWPLIRCAMESVAKLAILPMQDVLGLDSRHRMNTPGTTEGNWRWRFTWDQVPPDLAGKLKRMAQIYRR